MTNEKLIEEMLEEAQSISRKSEVIHRGDGDLEAPMVMTIQDSGLCVIYESSSGEPVTTLRYLLPELLKVRNKDGNRRFVTSTNKVPTRGTMKCLLHPEGTNREHYDVLGLPVCKKSNLTAPYIVEQHMKKRHPSAWAIIERERQDAEKQEQREHDRNFIKQMAMMAATRSEVSVTKEEPILPVSETIKRHKMKKKIK